MVTVIINNKVACVMTEAENNRITENGRKNLQNLQKCKASVSIAGLLHLVKWEDMINVN